MSSEHKDPPYWLISPIFIFITCLLTLLFVYILSLSPIASCVLTLIILLPFRSGIVGYLAWFKPQLYLKLHYPLLNPSPRPIPDHLEIWLGRIGASILFV